MFTRLCASNRVLISILSLVVFATVSCKDENGGHQENGSQNQTDDSAPYEGSTLGGDTTPTEEDNIYASDVHQRNDDTRQIEDTASDTAVTDDASATGGTPDTLGANTDSVSVPLDTRPGSSPERNSDGTQDTISGMDSDTTGNGENVGGDTAAVCTCDPPWVCDSVTGDCVCPDGVRWTRLFVLRFGWGLYRAAFRFRHLQIESV